MTAQHYCHSIHFRGSTHPQGRYQLQISELCTNGELRYRAQWGFPTLRAVHAFLQKNFPNSQAIATSGNQGLSFEFALSVVGC